MLHQATVIAVLREMVSAFNVYINECDTSVRKPHAPVCQQVEEAVFALPR
jgi:hypothetical protein